MADVENRADDAGERDPPPPEKPTDTKPDWTRECMVCGMSPVVPVSGMCGPCTFGDASTMHGNW